MATDKSTPPGDTIDLNDEDALRRWIDHFGVTEKQLREAVQAAGSNAEAVKRHLLNQGASSGAG